MNEGAGVDWWYGEAGQRLVFSVGSQCGQFQFSIGRKRELRAREVRGKCELRAGTGGRKCVLRAPCGEPIPLLPE